MSALPDLSALSLNGKCRKCLPIPADVSTGIPDAAAAIIEREECEICLEPLGDDSPQGEWKQPGRKWAVQCVNQHLIHKQCLLGKIVRSASSTQYNQADFDRFTNCSICSQPILDGVLRSVGVEIDRNNKTLDLNDVGLDQIPLMPDLPSIPGQDLPSNPNASPVANDDDPPSPYVPTSPQYDPTDPGYDPDEDNRDSTVEFAPDPEVPGMFASWEAIVEDGGGNQDPTRETRRYRKFYFDTLVLDANNPRYDSSIGFSPTPYFYRERSDDPVDPNKDETKMIHILYLFFDLKHMHLGQSLEVSATFGNLLRGIKPPRQDLLYRAGLSIRNRLLYAAPPDSILPQMFTNSFAFNPEHWGTFDSEFLKFQNTVADTAYATSFFGTQDAYARGLEAVALRWVEPATSLAIGVETIAAAIDNLITKGDNGGDGFYNPQQSPFALLQYDNYYYPATELSYPEGNSSSNRVVFASGRDVERSFTERFFDTFVNVDVARAINRVLVLMKHLVTEKYTHHVDALVYRRIYMMVEALLYHAPFYLANIEVRNRDFDDVIDHLQNLQWQIVIMLARGNLFLFYDQPINVDSQVNREPDLVQLSEVVRTVERHYEAGNQISVRQNRFGQAMNFTGRNWWRTLPKADVFLSPGNKYENFSNFDHELLLDYAKAAKIAGFTLRTNNYRPPSSPFSPTSPQYDPTEPGYDPESPQVNPGRGRSPTSDDDDLNLPPLRRQRIEMLLAEERERKRLELISKLKMCD